MADGTSGNVGEVSVSGGAAKWLAARAAESDLEPDEFVTRLLAAFRTIEESGEVSFATQSDLANLQADLDAVRSDLDERDAPSAEDVAELEERVREVADALEDTAAADHDHLEFEAVGERSEATAEALEALEEEVESLEEEVQAMDEEVADLREWAEEGFENYEEVLEYLTDRADDVDEKIGTLARVLVDVRQSVQALAAVAEDRAAAAALKHMANEQGVREAACGECENSLDVALLTDATCPFCGSTFSAVESSRRFGVFRSATLVTGERPALEAPDVEDGPDDDLEELVGDE